MLHRKGANLQAFISLHPIGCNIVHTVVRYIGSIKGVWNPASKGCISAPSYWGAMLCTLSLGCKLEPLRVLLERQRSAPYKVHI